MLTVYKDEDEKLEQTQKEHQDKLTKLERAQKHIERTMKLLKKKNVNVEKHEVNVLYVLSLKCNISLHCAYKSQGKNDFL